MSEIVADFLQLCSVLFPVSHSNLDWMIETGLISEAESWNRQSVAKVIPDIIADLQLAERH
jgi:hypothetical protein